jgi:hypothetical protein
MVPTLPTPKKKKKKKRKCETEGAGGWLGSPLGSRDEMLRKTQREGERQARAAASS